MSRDTLFWVLLGLLGVAVALLMINNDAGQTFGVENYQFASLVFLASIAVFVGLGVFGRGAPVGSLVRTAAVWLCVFLAVMVAYQVMARFDMLPENFRPPAVPSDPAAGTSAAIMPNLNGPYANAQTSSA